MATLSDTPTETGQGPIDLFEGRLWQLGAAVPATPELSWLPGDATGWEPLNCYLLLEPERALLVDTGAAITGDAVVRQLAEVLDPDKPLGVYLTRGEADCVGNLGLIAQHYNLTALYASGRSNPFDYFEDAAKGADLLAEPRYPLVRRQAGETIELNEARGLEVVRPLLRLLATSWGYDPVSRTLFTSDVFSHSHGQDRATAREPAGEGDGVTARDVARHVFTKFDWLEAVQAPAVLARDIDQIVTSREVDRIAPTHGRVIEGADSVERHRGWMHAGLMGEVER